MSKTITIEKSKLLLVEGIDEVRNLSCFLNQIEIDDIQLLNICGKTNFDLNLKLLIKQPNFSTVKSIGIIRDSDTDYNTTMQSIVNTLKNNGLNIGKNENGLPEISVYLMPKENTNGCLEEMFLNSKSNDPILECVDEYVKCVETKTKKSYAHEKLSKAKMCVFLASNVSDPDKRFAESTEAGIWDLNDPTFDPIKEFLKSI